MKKKQFIIVLCVLVGMMTSACADKTDKTVEAQNTDTTNTAIDSASDPNLEFSKEAQAMIPMFQAMNDYFMEDGNVYDPKDDTAYWKLMARVGAMCGQLYGEPLVTLEGDKYKITADVMRDFAYAAFAERNQLDTVPLPENLKNTVYYDYDWDAYFVQAGDAGAVKTIITSFKINKGGSHTAEVDFVDPADNNKVLRHYTYNLIDNEIADMSVFPYSVRSVTWKSK